MKYLKRLLLCIILTIFLVPNIVKADEKFNLYVFWGDGCPHCEEALKYFDSLDEETKNKFNLVKYEVWKDQNNADIMNKVANNIGIEVKGVPFIVIGKNHLSGYSENSNSQIIDYINQEYQAKTKTDYLEKGSSNKVNKLDKTGNIISLVLVISLVGIIGIIFGIKYITKESK